MPLHQLFSLFFQEIGFTFTEREVVQKRKKSHKSKKNTEQPILTGSAKKLPRLSLKTPQFHPPDFSHVRTSGFTKAMKRVFTPGPVKKNTEGKKPALIDEKNAEQETIVFPGTSQ